MRVLRFPARRWRLLAVPVALAGLLAAFAPAAASAAACVRVTAVPPPAAGGSVTELDGVTTASSCVAWAVGSSFGAGGVSRGVIEHYDGTGWSVAYVSAGSVPGESRALSAVTAISPTNVWAVGTAGGQMLILHFDGSSWTPQVISGPGSSNVLSAVTGTSASDIWAVGTAFSASGPGRQPLIEHYDGTGWSARPGPAIADAGSLSAVSATSATDAWAVGQAANSSGTSRTLAEHWNGTAWSVVASPSPGGAAGQLTGIAALTSNNAWAVGWSADADGVPHALIEHWTGNWTVAAGPDIGSPASSEYLGAAATSDRDVWAVGFRDSGTLAAHFDGNQWVMVPSPSPESGSVLLAVGASSSTNAWMVGGGGTTTQPAAINCC